MTRIAVPAVAAVLLMVACGALHSKWTESWPWGRSIDDEVQVFVDRLEKVPSVFGDWEGEDNEPDERQLAVAKLAGVVQRTYTNRLTGQQVSLFLVCGRARNVAVHTPDKCYPAAGFKMSVEGQQRYPVEYDSHRGEFYIARFSKDTPDGSAHLRVFWSWNGSGDWVAPFWAKVALARHRRLFKMYAISVLPQPNAPVGEDPAVEFLQEFMAEIQPILFPEGAEEPATVASR